MAGVSISTTENTSPDFISDFMKIAGRRRGGIKMLIFLKNMALWLTQTGLGYIAPPPPMVHVRKVGEACPMHLL